MNAAARSWNLSLTPFFRAGLAAPIYATNGKVETGQRWQTKKGRLAPVSQFVQLFAAHSSEIKKSARRLQKHAAAGALVWISHQTKTSGIASDLSRKAVCEAISGTGWRAVAIVP